MRSDGHEFWRRWLPYGVAAFLVITLVAGGVAAEMLNRYKQNSNLRTTTPAVEGGLSRLEAAVEEGGAESLSSKAVEELFRDLPYAGMSVLVDVEGNIVYRKLPGYGAQVPALVTPQLGQLLASLPAGALSKEQQLLLQTAYVVQAEGEHADIYRYTARLLRDGQGNVVGAVAVAYARNTTSLPLLCNGLLLGSLLALALYWISLPLWVFFDARTHGERAWLWAALALVGNLLGVVTYLLMRRPLRRACPQCGAAVRPADNACPQCGTRLHLTCASCHGPLEAGWKFCPRCAASMEQAPAAE